jgi:hypothetical protein
MCSESVCQVALSWVDVGSFHRRLVVTFSTFTALVLNIVDTPLYLRIYCGKHTLERHRTRWNCNINFSSGGEYWSLSIAVCFFYWSS